MDAKKHYQTLYETAAGAFSFQAQTIEELQTWQNQFRPRLQEILGLDQIQRDLAGHQPHAERLASEELDGYTREQWQLQVEPTLALPFYLLRPHQASGPRPLILIPHGHNHPHIYVGLYNDEEERQNIIGGDRDIAVQAVKEGYIAIAPTTRGFGDTRTEEDLDNDKLSSCRIQLMHGLLLGRTPIGERVWDMSRLLDWALENLDIDEQRIAITGNSGGGTVSLFAAACETRISLAMPGSYFNTFAGSIGSIFHCDCNYVPGILQLGEMYDVAGLIAPRPFCAIAGEEDPIFPIAEAQLAYEKLRQVYEVAGNPDDCRLYVGKGGHRYYKDGAWPFVREQFDKMGAG
jgi:hypothetical protein